MDIFADNGNRHFAVGRSAQLFNHALPWGEIRGFCPDIQFLNDLIIQPFLVQSLRHCVDMVGIR